MGKWWRPRREEPHATPPAPPPPAESEISLPDPEEARETLAQSRENKRRTDELVKEIREVLDSIRAAREDNHFSDALTSLIWGGRGE